ncbi:MAG: DJ-1/PfpI family protein [Asgard group archaeon]|nr:DJ-1/PfpI family protein [Asgard group archaeon]
MLMCFNRKMIYFIFSLIIEFILSPRVLISFNNFTKNISKVVLLKDGWKKISLVLFIFSIMFLGSTLTVTKSARNNVKILCFIDNGFGESYYINKGFLESYGFTIVTASYFSFVLGCTNFGKNITDTYSDILAYEITDEELSEYDCVLVPSGGHWATLTTRARTMELIELAHDEGIPVAGICTGMIVLAFAGILENVSVAQNSHAVSWLSLVGANMTTESVVSDQGIITGGFGGGVGLGPDNAPNEEFCLKIKEEIDSNVSASFNPLLMTVAIFTALAFLLVIFRSVKLRR